MTPDIWVDHDPFGTFDQAQDAVGRPDGNGDNPKPGELNHIVARVNCSGASGTSNVKVTFYSVELQRRRRQRELGTAGHQDGGGDQSEQLRRCHRRLGSARRSSHLSQGLRGHPAGRAVGRQQHGDRVRVIVTNDQGERNVEEAFTDDQQHFEVDIDVRRLGAPDPGVYTVQAFTFAAATVAEAVSNVVSVHF